MSERTTVWRVVTFVAETAEQSQEYGEIDWIAYAAFFGAGALAAAAGIAVTLAVRTRRSRPRAAASERQRSAGDTS